MTHEQKLIIAAAAGCLDGISKALSSEKGYAETVALTRKHSDNLMALLGLPVIPALIAAESGVGAQS